MYRRHCEKIHKDFRRKTRRSAVSLVIRRAVIARFACKLTSDL
ncbi:hypothetical protein [Helicobacter sp. MIT 01-3238]|nr:hypothetical protein [Helicobacter sp. MIT 01-3238]